MSRNRKIEFPCVLKTIIRHTNEDNKSFTLNDKQIRQRLRNKFGDAHIKNTSWIATNMRDYDLIRCAYDVQYANAKTNARKRNNKTRATKKNVTTNEVNND